MIMDSRNAGNRYDLVDRRHDHHRPDRPVAGWTDAPAGGNPLGQVALCALRSRSASSARASQSDKGPLQVVDDVSFTRAATASSSPSSGPRVAARSTLMNMMAGFIRPDTGAVIIDGAPRSKPDSKGILISQQGSVFPWLTVRENLMFGLNGHAPATSGHRGPLCGYRRSEGLRGELSRTSCPAACSSAPSWRALWR